MPVLITSLSGGSLAALAVGCGPQMNRTSVSSMSGIHWSRPQLKPSEVSYHYTSSPCAGLSRLSSPLYLNVELLEASPTGIHRMPGFASFTAFCLPTRPSWFDPRYTSTCFSPRPSRGRTPTAEQRIDTFRRARCSDFMAPGQPIKAIPGCTCFNRYVIDPAWIMM